MDDNMTGLKPLTIAIDFDDTYTADPELWTSFMNQAESRGHKVICVTARYFTLENKEELKATLPPKTLIYFTSMGSKMDYMASQGVKVDIWIDDSPRVVVHGV